MRINGRVLRPSTLSERRLLLSTFGTAIFRVPRSMNPFSVARRMRRLAANEELAYFVALGRRTRRRADQVVNPEPDSPEPRDDADPVSLV